MLFDERKTELVQVRMTPKMKNKLREIAKRENRTISSLIDNMVVKEMTIYDKDIIDLCDDKSKKEVFQFRLTASIKELVVEESQKEGRSISNYIENCIIKILKENGRIA